MSRRTAFYVLLLTCLFANLFPFYWMTVTSLKSWAGVFTYPPTFLPFPIASDAYVNVVQNTGLAKWILNTIIVGVPTTILSLVCSVSGAYSLSRFHFRGRGLAGLLILVTQMIPGTILVIPLYLIFKSLGLVNTFPALIIAYATIGLPFCIWMLKGYFDAIPIELEEAAAVDGCTRVMILWKIVAPLSLPGLAVTAMFAFVLVWNDLIIAIALVTSPAMRTNAVGLSSFIGELGTSWGEIMSASVISSIPILLLFLFLQRYMVFGLTAGAVKG